MMKRGIIVVDFGTSRVHTNLINIDDGSIIAQNSARYQWQHPLRGWTEIDPEEVWQASLNTVGTVLSETVNHTEICGITFSFIGDSLIPVNKDGAANYNMIMSFDKRAESEVAGFVDRIGQKDFMGITGTPILPMCVGLKILWLKKNLPEVFNNTDFFFSIQQYVISKLGFSATSDYTLATRQTMFDIRKRKWSRTILDIVGISNDQVGRTATEASAILGAIKKYGEVELPYKIPVILGSHDSECGLIGLGVHPGGSDILGNVGGTFDHIGCYTSNFINLPHDGDLIIGCGPIGNNYVILGVSFSGSNMEWFIKKFFQAKNDDIYPELFNRVRFDGRAELLFIPGVESSSGCLLGLDHTTGLTDIFRSIVEGVSFQLKIAVDNAERVHPAGFRSVRAGAGGAKSDKWMQLKADVLNKRVERVKNLEVSSLGAAIIAGTGLGIYRDFDEAITEVVSIDKIFEPDENRCRRYNERFNDFIRLKAHAKIN